MSAEEGKYTISLMAWIESLVITILFIIVSEMLHDPLSLKSPFPWVWFAPVLIALRYGLWPSQLSILLCLLPAFYEDSTQINTIHVQLFILGGFLLTLVCVIFQQGWSKKISYSDKISDYLQKRIQTIAYAYKIVSLAYKRLEHSFVSKPVTIRSSLGELREMLAKSTLGFQEDILNRFLNIVALHCSLEIAGIFTVENNRVMPKPIASIGKIRSPDPNDFLIKESIDNVAMTYVTAEEVLKGHLSHYLVVAPFLNQAGDIYALLVIEEMPFLSLNEENLEIINLLLQYFMEGNTIKNANKILKRFPDCSVDFANELQRLTNIQKNINQDSAVALFLLSENPHQQDYLFTLNQEKRGIDTSWNTMVNNQPALIILMPLTSRPGVESYKMRINSILLREFNITLNNKEISFRSYQLSSINNPIHLIENLLDIT